jgi:hypothetical protein
MVKWLRNSQPCHASEFSRRRSSGGRMRHETRHRPRTARARAPMVVVLDVIAVAIGRPVAVSRAIVAESHRLPICCPFRFTPRSIEISR